MPSLPSQPSIKKGGLYDSLEGKSYIEKANLKCAEFCKRKGKKFQKDNLEIVITNPILFGDEGFEVTAKVWKDGVEIPLGNKNPLRFINPPILIPDGTKSEIEIPFGNETKKTQVDNLKEDIDGALEFIVYEHIKVLLK